MLSKIIVFGKYRNFLMQSLILNNHRRNAGEFLTVSEAKFCYVELKSSLYKTMSCNDCLP